jgi:hypothetical protein
MENKQQIEDIDGEPLETEVNDDIGEDLLKALDELETPPDLDKEAEGEEEPEGEQAPEGQEEQPVETQEAAQSEGKRKEYYDAPVDWSAEEKELFYKAPKKVREAFHRRAKEQQAQFTRITQRIAEKERHVDDVVSVTNKYIAKWGRAGLTPAQAVTALASMQDRLTAPETQTRKEAFAELFVNSGLSGDDFMDIIQGAGKTLPQKQAPASQQPHLTQADIARQQYIDSMMMQQWQTQVNTAVSQIEAVRNERDAAGRFIFPKMHDQNFLETQIKPLAMTMMQQQPGLNWGEAARRAYLALDPSIASRLAEAPRVTRRVSPTIRANGNPAPRQSAAEVPDDLEAQLLQAWEQAEANE